MDCVWIILNAYIKKKKRLKLGSQNVNAQNVNAQNVWIQKKIDSMHKSI